MSKLIPLLAASLVLGGLLWMDNQPAEPPSVPTASLDDEAPAADMLISEATDDVAETPPPPLTDPVDDITAEPSGTAQPAADAETQTANSNPLASLDGGSLRDMVERPLFAPSRRRPPVVEKVNTTAPVKTPEAFELLGIAKSNQRTIALIRRVTDGASFRLQTGDSVDNWTLAKIERASIVLNGHDGSTAVVQLGPSKKACAPGSSAACPVQPPPPADFMP